VKKYLAVALTSLLPFLDLEAKTEHKLPDDQLLVIFGGSGYVLYKVLDFANDHGFRYIKILSYEFKAFEHTLSGTCTSSLKEGRFFELKDHNATVSFLCFDEKPDDIYIIDLEKYRSILEDVAKIDE
jgi:hypothetical protein